jgi:uncharacterized protein with PQ loop repeat
MTANYLMYSASILYFVCYVPELYANYKNKNVNAYNVPEKIIMLAATTLALTYAVVNENAELMTNYAPLLMLDVVALLMRLHYTCVNRNISEENAYKSTIEITCDERT